MYDPDQPRHIAKVSSSALLAKPSSRSEPGKPSERTMTDLWFRMTAMYGHRWSTTFADNFEQSGPTGRMWQAALTGVTNAQIAHGLHGCLTRDDGAWPPALPEFRALCLAGAKPQQSNPGHQPYTPQRADPARMPSPERYAWHQANIAWVEKGGELPRPGVNEPPAPAGVMAFWEIYKGPDNRDAAQKAAVRDPMSEGWL